MLVGSVSCESGLVRGEDVSDFLLRFSKKLEEYDPKNAFNCDETGLMWKVEQKGVILNKEDKLGEKFAKERISILLFASMARRK